ncbi:hypothetical protein KEM48_009218 [Puccinia striiformis f. sp. tritici PST-130]|nr:hypothetical protein KEM48_009218 [Puccinia striiformis f. sp. tritici PST-130]
MAIDYLVSLGPRNNSNNNIRFKLIQTIYDYKLLDKQVEITEMTTRISIIKQTQYRANHWDLIYNRLLHQRNRSSFTFLNQARRNQALTTKKKEIEIGSAKYHKLKKTHPAPINTYLAGNEETIILVLNTNDYINHLRLIDQRLRNMVDVGMDLPSEILAYLILFKLPSNFQSLKRQCRKDRYLDWIDNEDQSKQEGERAGYGCWILNGIFKSILTNSEWDPPLGISQTINTSSNLIWLLLGTWHSIYRAADIALICGQLCVTLGISYMVKAYHYSDSETPHPSLLPMSGCLFCCCFKIMIALTNLSDWFKAATQPPYLQSEEDINHNEVNQLMLSRHQMHLQINFTNNKTAQALPFVMTTRSRSLRPSLLRSGIIRTIYMESWARLALPFLQPPHLIKYSKRCPTASLYACPDDSANGPSTTPTNSPPSGLPTTTGVKELVTNDEPTEENAVQ